MSKLSYPNTHILVVDDEQTTTLMCSSMLLKVGIHNVTTINDSREVLPFLTKQNNVRLVILDLFMPHISGTELLIKIKENFPDIQVVVITASDDVEMAVKCMQAGALDYLLKPIERERLISSVQRVFELYSLHNEISSLKKQLLTDTLEREEAFSSIITDSQNMISIFKYIEAIAISSRPVMITGETGVGKELVAEAIHKSSLRKGKFVSVNIAGLDDNVFSDTLFGHTRGAYTGADRAREGLIARASGGTLFLDEIGDIDESSQIKLLRLLQENKYYPLGSDIPMKSEARIVVATHQDIKELQLEGKFRKDLYYRLSTHHIHIPPLRERSEDIPLLFDYFLEKEAKLLNKIKPKVPVELITLLSTYHFPGNIRELQGMVYDAMARCESGMMSMNNFKAIINQESTSIINISTQSNGESPLIDIFGRFPTLKSVEDYVVEEALRLSGNNQGIAASLLGMKRQTLNRRLIRKKQK
jgi:two-component system response regulator HydG